MTEVKKTYDEIMSELQSTIIYSDDVEARHDATKKAFSLAAIKKNKDDDETAETLKPFNQEIVSVCLEFYKTMSEFEPVEPKEHPEKLSKPKQKTIKRLEFWKAEGEDAAEQLTKHSGVFFTSALKVAELADYAEEIVQNEKKKICSLQVLATEARNAKKAADKKAKAAEAASDKEDDESDDDVAKTPEQLKAEIEALVVRLWKLSDEADYTSEMMIKLFTEAKPKPKADIQTDKLNAMRGKTNRVTVKPMAKAKAKTSKTKLAAAS